MRDVRDLCFLRVKGINQFEKEINEIRNIDTKVIDLNALHRNEITNEIEGENEKGATISSGKPDHRLDSRQTKDDQPDKNEMSPMSPKHREPKNNFVLDRRSIASQKTLSFNKSYSDSSEDGESQKGQKRRDKMPKPKKINYHMLKINDLLAQQIDKTKLF